MISKQYLMQTEILQFYCKIDALDEKLSDWQYNKTQC